MWTRPSPDNNWTPRWGLADGLQVGLEPHAGPRGLLRIYAPHLGQTRLLNFIAVEPTPLAATERGFSELEHSRLDDVPGKRLWSTDDPADACPRATTDPAPGVVWQSGGAETITVWVQCERFDNGAEIVVRLRFRADQPHEVELAAFRRPGSAELHTCVLTATMGNYARLRRLHLRDRVVTPADLWPGFLGPDFADHASFGVDELTPSDNAFVVCATPDETDPQNADYAPGTADHWHYTGQRAIQGWRIEDPSPTAIAQVNARYDYWASRHPIPGGPSYENFECVDTFRDGQTFAFWVEPLGDDGNVADAMAAHGKP